MVDFDLGGLYGLAIHLGFLLQFTLIHFSLSLGHDLPLEQEAAGFLCLTRTPSLRGPGLSENRGCLQPLLPRSWGTEKVMGPPGVS